MNDFALLDLSKSYTYSDYLKWEFSERVELIKGKVFMMSPAPRRIHQQVSRDLSYEIQKVVKATHCELFVAPFDVRLVKEVDDQEVINVVQPDLCVICDPEKLDEMGCLGAPDLVIEILSPSTSKKDAQTKYKLYQEFDVKEYWLVNTADHLVTVFDLIDGTFALRKIFAKDDEVESKAVQGLIVNLGEVFK